MTKITKEQLSKELDDLKDVIEAPNLFLACYFCELRNKVDKEIVSKQAKLQEDKQKLAELNKIWKEIISRIDSFEKQVINCKLKLEKNRNIINYMLTALGGEEAVNLEESKEAFDNEYLNLMRTLFQTNTIVFVNTKEFLDESKRTLIDSKLIVLNDVYVSFRTISKR